MKYLKASFRHNIANHEIVYPKSQAILLISVGQDYHEGEKFAATIDAINRANFQHCTIVLGDINHSYNLCFYTNLCPKDLEPEANQMGDAWLERNMPHIQKLKVPYKISRWTEWTHHPQFDFYLNELKDLYKTDKTCHEAFQKSAQDYLMRYEAHTGKAYTEKEMALSIDYLIEECAIIMPLWAELGFNFIIYPSKMFEAMAYCFDHFVKPSSKTLLHWLPLRFKRVESSEEEFTS